MVIIMWLFRRSPPDRVSNIFSKVQIVAAAFVAYAHGKNDGQMPIGIIALGLMIYYGKEQFDIPLWALFASAASVALGIGFGGWRVIRTVGTRITTLRPVHGSAAEISAAAVIEAASNLGIPVSTTQCISGSVIGVGATNVPITNEAIKTWECDGPYAGLSTTAERHFQWFGITEKEGFLCLG